MSDAQLSAMSLKLDTLLARAETHEAQQADMMTAFEAFMAGQTLVLESMDLISRQLDELNKSVGDEADNQVVEILSAALTSLHAIERKLNGLSAEVAEEVVLKSGGAIDLTP